MISTENKNDAMNISMNTSVKGLFCNHCLIESISIEAMKEHYKSDLHRYNLTRITSNLRPLTLEEFEKKKLHFETLKQEENRKKQKLSKNPNENKYTCTDCKKLFSTINKLNEHLSSKAHLVNIKTKDEDVNKEKHYRILNSNMTTLDDLKICVFCNNANESIELNFDHMIKTHKLEIPLYDFLEDHESCLKLIAKKVFTYKACLGCDGQNFLTVNSLQNHMLDTNHIYVNLEDLEDHLFKFYDSKKLAATQDPNIRLTKAFKILKNQLKFTKKQAEEAKMIDDEEEEEDDDFEPIELPNGELILQDGKVLGNKIYNLYYKQRVRVTKYDGLVKSEEFQRRIEKFNFMKKLQHNQRIKRGYFKKKNFDKNKNIMRQNTLFRACKQVNV